MRSIWTLFSKGAGSVTDRNGSVFVIQESGASGRQITGRRFGIDSQGSASYVRKRHKRIEQQPEANFLILNFLREGALNDSPLEIRPRVFMMKK